MAHLYKKPVVVVDPTTGKKTKTKSKKWWGKYRDAAGMIRRVPLAGDKTAAQTMLTDLVRRVDREKAGLIDPTDDQRKRPLAKHLTEFTKYLKNKNVTPKQVKESTMQIQRMVDDRKWKMIGDITASGAHEFLGQLRRDNLSAQTYNHYLKSAKQFTRWLVRDRRTPNDPLAHISKMNVSIDRRHDRRALAPEEFARLITAAQNGPSIETLSGADRAMIYVLAAWTGFRKGEIGSLTQRSFRLDDEPATATVAACYSKRRRQDTQILHSEVVCQLKVWLATKPDLGPDDILFPVSGRVPGGTERKTYKMMRLDIEAARKTWIEETKVPEERKAREESDFLTYQNDDGLFADFHSNRHLFITNLERAGLSPKMAQTLARHSDVRLTLGVYTHVGLHDQTAAIASLPPPPGGKDTETEAAELRATGTEGRGCEHQMVPPAVPSGAQIGAHVVAPKRLRISPGCTEAVGEANEKGDRKIAVRSNGNRRYCTNKHQGASPRTAPRDGSMKVSPARLELATFGSGGRHSIQLSYGDGKQSLIFAMDMKATFLQNHPLGVHPTGLEPVTFGSVVGLRSRNQHEITLEHQILQGVMESRLDPEIAATTALWQQFWQQWLPSRSTMQSFFLGPGKIWACGQLQLQSKEFDYARGESVERCVPSSWALFYGLCSPKEREPGPASVVIHN